MTLDGFGSVVSDDTEGNDNAEETVIKTNNKKW